MRGADTSALAACGSSSRYGLPLGQQQHGIGLVQRRLQVRFQLEFREALGGVGQGLGIGDRHHGALQLQLRGGAQRGGVPDVVAFGLEGRAQDGDPLAQQGPAAEFPRELHHPGPAPHVDGVHLAQESQRLVGAQLAGAGHERTDVLGQAAAAETDAGVQELPADPLVEPDRIGQPGDVGAGGFTDLGHGVDEGNLGGEERVGGRLHQFGRGVVRHQPGCSARERGLVDLVQDGHRGMVFAAVRRP